MPCIVDNQPIASKAKLMAVEAHFVTNVKAVEVSTSELIAHTRKLRAITVNGKVTYSGYVALEDNMVPVKIPTPGTEEG